jgi:hypothetical protein
MTETLGPQAQLTLKKERESLQRDVAEQLEGERIDAILDDSLAQVSRSTIFADYVPREGAPGRARGDLLCSLSRPRSGLA